MAKRRITRKELLKKPDEFMTFSRKIITFIRGHSRLFEYIGVVAVALVLLYLGINTYMKHMNTKGLDAYNRAFKSIVKSQEPNADPEELARSEELFSEVTDNYGISKAARLALPELAFIRYLEKDYDGAITLYHQFMDKLSDDDPYQSFARIALAVCYEEKGEFEEAIKNLEQVISGSDGFFKEQAMLNLARIYRISQKPEKSDEILKEFIEKFKTSTFLPMAKAYLNDKSSMHENP